jgi:hypothetical protein
MRQPVGRKAKGPPRVAALASGPERPSRAASPGPSKAGFGSSTKPRTGAVSETSRRRSATPTRHSQVPRCATPEGRRSSITSRAQMDEELVLRARWNAELDRTKKLLNEKKRMEQEAAFRATKEAKERLKDAERESEAKELRMQREHDNAWRESQKRLAITQRLRERQEKAQKIQEERDVKELQRQLELGEKHEVAVNYSQEIKRTKAEEQQKLLQQKRILRERQQAATEHRHLKLDEEESTKDAQRREALVQSELEFAWRQRQACAKMQQMMVG